MRYNFSGGRKLLAFFSIGAATIGLTTALAVGAWAHGSSHRRAHASQALSITSEPFGTANGQPVRLYTLSNGHGMTVKITNYGGVIQSIWVPDRAGNVKNVALGFSNLAGYVKDFTDPAPGGSGDTYFGGIIGRYANRIANGQFTLNGVTHHLPQNNGVNTLHGGPNSYNTQVWDATTATSAHSVSLRLSYTDPAGKNGFPGTVVNHVTYALTQDNALRIEYHATTNEPTVINLTNHTYFNLAGEGSGDVYGQLLKINADSFTPTDATLIPTGEIAPVGGTPFDFRTLKAIGRDIRNAGMPEGNQLVLAHGYDHNWVLDGSGMKLAAVAEDPSSGRVLRTYTTEPGVQFYSGNFLVGDLVGTSGHTYRQSDGFTLETQHYPDSPNHPTFPSTVLNPGQAFSSSTVYQFSTAPRG